MILRPDTRVTVNLHYSVFFFTNKMLQILLTYRWVKDLYFITLLLYSISNPYYLIVKIKKINYFKNKI